MGPNDTVWSPRSGEGEYTQGSANLIDDSSSDLLVDSSGDFVADSGVVFVPIADTTWVEDDTA